MVTFSHGLFLGGGRGDTAEENKKKIEHSTVRQVARQVPRHYHTILSHLRVVTHEQRIRVAVGKVSSLVDVDG